MLAFAANTAQVLDFFGIRPNSSSATEEPGQGFPATGPTASTDEDPTDDDSNGSEQDPGPTVAPPPTVEEQSDPATPGPQELESVLLTLDDLPGTWREFSPPFGAEGLDADEFCGQVPEADTLLEVTASFAEAPVNSPTLYTVAGLFPSGEAERFLQTVEALATSCQGDGWDLIPAEGQPPIRTHITTLERLEYGDEAVRVIATGPPAPEIDYIYIRQGDIVGSVAYSIQDLPFRNGDEAVDPDVTEDLARLLSQRLALVEQPG